jgi:NAD(P) transhydrogenase subunit beta
MTEINIAFLVAAVCFILTLQGLSAPSTARRGNTIGAVGMAIAVLAVLIFDTEIVRYEYIVGGILVGGIIGAIMAAKIPMTKMPERIALSHAFGGLAVALLGISHYIHHDGALDHVRMAAFGFEVLFGALTFTGSLMAFAKLQGLISGSPISYKGQNVFNITLFALAFASVIYLVVTADPEVSGNQTVFYAMCVIGFALGVLFVLPIGGADMPVVISLLNSYAGLAMSATGFALDNNILIIAGALDGTSGFLLSIKMSQAMNRSFTNVLFGAFGGESSGGGAGQAGDEFYEGKIKSTSAEELAMILEGAQSVVFVPGYGMAVSQAQHAVRELADTLKENGCEIRYAIHPVAGRMPGHMNVLLAEADIPYDELLDMDEINPLFPETDVAIVIGANDVTNPLAKEDPKSPIAGMPILEVEKANTVVVVKRSLAPGFAGVPNPLFIRDNCLMAFEDGKKFILHVNNALKG